jgi:hypothetical protein
MNKSCLIFLCLGGICAVSTSRAIDLKQSKITQVVNDVQIISAEDQKQKTAAINDVFSMPDILRTGAASRAELMAQDQTVTRVGANTVFSFDPANRTIDLKQGSLLFHAPHGKGGGSIHTGSATASVLGTTIIVVATPNGGFKVLCLEGQAEIKFLNGLHQKLDPGQMTFVLPGGNQLAPVIIFRLDELTQNSLLVKGFSDSLDSMPLIKNQIEKQIKLIQSGKFGDTGLYAGDDASPNQVEVLDLNTIPHQPQQQQQQPQQQEQQEQGGNNPPPPQSTLAAAEAADATINKPKLSDATPTPPVHVFTDTAFPVPNNPYFNGQTFQGFVARNIYVNTLWTPPEETPSLSSRITSDTGALAVDLSPYVNISPFALVAINTFSLQGSVTFGGLSPSQDLSLIAGGQFDFTSGISIRADAHNFLMSSPGGMIFDNVTLENLNNDITLNSDGDVDLRNGSQVFATGKFTVNSHGNITLEQYSGIYAGSTVLSTLAGTLTINNSTIQTADHVFLIAPGAINLNNAFVSGDYVVLNDFGNAPADIEGSSINVSSSLVAGTSADLTVGGSSLSADTSAGSISLLSSSGDVNVSGTAISTHDLTMSAGDSITYDGGVEPPVTAAVQKRYLTLQSGDDILLPPSRHVTSKVSESSPGTANLTAVNTVTVNNADFTPYAIVNMVANTINLYNVAFGGTVNLNSLNGVWNNGTIVYGDVNNLGGVTYNRNPVYAPNGFSGTIPGTGITIGTR